MSLAPIDRPTCADEPSGIIDHRTTLAPYRLGRSDPTTQLSSIDCWRATLTPDGPATAHIWWSRNGVDAQTWGAGASWLHDQIPAMAGMLDPGIESDRLADTEHPAVARARRNHPGLRLGASRTLYHELLPIVISQRVTSVEAVRQWRQLCLTLGESAPGPNAALRLPPNPQRILAKPPWWFHRFGIESKRAQALRTVARYADRIHDWSAGSARAAAERLQLLPGIGAWTIGSALGPVFGEPDAVAVGDYHIPYMVTWALAGEARGTDERMMQLLDPYVGQRGRVVRLLGLDGHAAPKFGPRQRIQPIHKW